MSTTEEGFDGSLLAGLVGKFRTDKGAPVMRKSKGAMVRDRLELEDQDISKVDRRKSGRVHQMNLRVSSATREHFRALCAETGWIPAEVLEHALEALKATRTNSVNSRKV